MLEVQKAFNMDQDLKNKTLERLTKAQNILIAVPQSSAFDALASGLALYLAARKLGKNASIFGREPTVSDANQLYGVDKIGKSASDSFVIVVDDAVSTVDKVTYFLDKNRLKITIHPLGGSKGVNKNQISYENAPIKPDFVFALGFDSVEQLKHEITQEQNFDPETWIISVNKSSPSQKFAQVAVSSPDAASLSEVTAQLLQELALPLNEDIAYNLYAGISEATQNFSLSLTKPSTFQIASFLVKFGAAKASFAGYSVKEPVKDDQRHEQAPLNQPFSVQPTFKSETPIEEVEKEKGGNGKNSEADWLKPPKIYKGTNSFDKEY